MIQQLGMAILGGGMQEIANQNSHRRNIDAQRDQMMLQQQLNKDMTDYNTDKQMDMWNKTGYGAQMKQMKDAGLNPALMYGKGGAGGSTAIAAASGSAGNAPQIQPIDASKTTMGLMQLANMEAQKENIIADTNLKDVQANKLKGADTENLQEGTKGKVLENQYLTNSMSDRITKAYAEGQKGVAEANKAGVEQNVAIATEKNQIKQSDLQTINDQLRNTLTNKNITKTEAETNNVIETLTSIVNERVLKRKGLTIQEQGNAIREAQVEIAKELGRRGLDMQQTKMYIDGIGKLIPAMIIR